MKSSFLANRVEASRGRTLFNMASQIPDAINLTLGDPDIMPPVSMRNAVAIDRAGQNEILG